MHADWYFDFVSPNSYFASLQLDALPADLEIRFRPVLFAGLLNHWGQKGPAEIPSKRLWTYRWCIWWAKKQGVPFLMPATHPFNPIAYLRLAIAADCTQSAINRIFHALWATGVDPQNHRVVEDLAGGIGVDPDAVERQAIKNRLKQETDRAIATGVFGVPTLVIDGQIFWGNESLEMANHYLSGDSLFDSDEMRRLGDLPASAQRNRQQ